MLRDRIVDVVWHPLQNVVVCVSGTTGQVSCEGADLHASDHQSVMSAPSCWADVVVTPFQLMQRHACRVLRVDRTTCSARGRVSCHGSDTDNVAAHRTFHGTAWRVAMVRQLLSICFLVLI